MTHDKIGPQATIAQRQGALAALLLARVAAGEANARAAAVAAMARLLLADRRLQLEIEAEMQRLFEAGPLPEAPPQPANDPSP